jgi:tetratricopeptide (TPR) repeat protein
MSRLIFFTSLLLSTLTLPAQLFNQPDFRTTVYEGLELTYQMRYDEADAFFKQVVQQYPEHPSGYFMRAYNRWWQTYTSVTTDAYYEFIEQQIALALDKNERLKGESVREHAFFSYMSYALRARLDAYRNQFFTAVNQARKAIPAVKKSLKFVGQEPEFYLVAGLYHYYVETYSDYYPIVRPLMYFFPDGDIEEGLKELELAANTPSFTQQEARFFLSYIYLDEIKELAKGLGVARSLHQSYPTNTWFKTDYARALLLNEQYDAGKSVLLVLRKSYEQQRQASSRNITCLESRHTTYLMIKVYHYLGYEALFGRNQYEEALTFFQTSNQMARLSGVEEDNYLAGNQLYIGMCQDQLGQRDRAVEAYELVLDMEENALYKEEAKTYLKTPSSPPFR